MRFVAGLWVVFALGGAAGAQTTPMERDLKLLVETPGVSGYERHVGDAVVSALKPLRVDRDAMGNIVVRFGSGAPHRLLAASLDEPGYVVSRIEPDGFLRVQSLPQAGLPPHFHEMHNAQPMAVETRDGKTLSAVVAGASIHLTPGRKNVPDPDDLDAMYVDLGAKTAAEVRGVGVDVLSPLAAERALVPVGMHRFAGTAVGDRYGVAVLLELARALQGKVAAGGLQGSVTLAFVTQQWTGSRGLTRVLEAERPDELIFVGRGRRDARAAEGSGVAAGLRSGAVRFTAANDAAWPEMETAVPHSAAAAAVLQRGYGPPAVLPAHAAHLGVPLRYPLTAGESVDTHDLHALLSVLEKYVGLGAAPANEAGGALGRVAFAAAPARPAAMPSNRSVLEALSLSYGVSEQEARTREAVAALLPAWAHPTTDAAGNLILKLGTGKGPGTVFMAHTDELGFRVRSVDADGMLELDNKGGGSPAFYWGHPALLHTKSGSVGAVVALPEGFDTAAFKFPSDFRAPARLDVGAASGEEVAAMGIAVGDSVTIPKRFRPMLDGRVSVRSLDDRVGCTALVHAAWALGPKFDRNVTLVWSTQEELGLLGAVAYAANVAKAGEVPQTVFAIDTFVSSDSPVESHRFGDAVLGEGFVVRAVDNSNIVPWDLVQRVSRIAAAHKVAVQYGVTGGGNDGAAFQRYGATDVALSWPLRYSHSPGEVVDMRDVDALAEITAALAREW